MRFVYTAVIFTFILTACSNQIEKRGKHTVKESVFLNTTDMSQILDSSLVGIFGLRKYVDSINTFIDTVPQFLLNPCFDNEFNLTGKAMDHGSAINPSARFEIIQAVTDSSVLIKLRSVINKYPSAHVKPAYLKSCYAVFDSIEYSTISNFELLSIRIKKLSHQ